MREARYAGSQPTVARTTAAPSAALLVVGDERELCRLLDRQGAEEQAVHEREDRGVGVDAERQRERRKRRHDRRRAKRLQGQGTSVNGL